MCSRNSQDEWMEQEGEWARDEGGVMGTGSGPQKNMLKP